MSKTLGFIVGLVGWLYVLGELYVGEAGRANAKCGSKLWWVRRNLTMRGRG
jgi:hypothetical protein